MDTSLDDQTFLDDIYTNDFTISTPMVTDLRRVVLGWIARGYIGAFILGKPRIGKSRGLALIKDTLINRTGKRLPTFIVSIPQRDCATIKSLYTILCVSLGFKPNRSASATDMACLVTHFLSDAAIMAGTRQVVLIVDEMQRLSYDQIAIFAEQYDELEREKKHLIVLFVGNYKESSKLLKAIISSDANDHIRGRFFEHSYHFKGISNKAQLASCLTCYDSPVAGQTKSITESLAPHLYRSGWRLASVCDDMWAVFVDYQRGFGFDSLPMQYFVSTVSTLLIDLLPEADLGRPDSLHRLIEQSMSVSGLIPSLIVDVKEEQ